MALGLRTTGRAAKAVSAELERELGLEDVALLLDEKGVQAPQIKEFRERHHALARLIAEGKKPGEAALMQRYSQSRMSVLLADPAFRELVEHYRSIVDEAFLDFQQQLAALALDATMIMRSRMEDTPDDLSDAVVLQIIQVGADRTGHGPSQKVEHNHKVGLADRLMSATARVAKMRDVTPVEIEDDSHRS